MRNHTQITLIQRWERDHYRLGNEYKNKLSKKPVEVVERELAEIAENWKNMTFSVVPKGSMKIEGDRNTIFKKR
ncbi:hypothetical protein [Streptococcus constellatus]|uniref:hypothetical protein n=1 Tax=Streptococcus constellatus TaxID=76860 RepID=UPI0028E65DA7|nr:hypothetical protein [Streptococcus constellatus]